jgi:hypothetical protein
MAGKQIINVVQFWKASKIVSPYEGVEGVETDEQLVGVDLAERQAARDAAVRARR